ncbi:hypothetical protein TIFTF001_042670, partial [Ficus carica]
GCVSPDLVRKSALGQCLKHVDLRSKDVRNAVCLPYRLPKCSVEVDFTK